MAGDPGHRIMSQPQSEVMMNKIFGSVFVGVCLVAVVAGCQKNDGTTNKPTVGSSATAGNSKPLSQPPMPDPSRPDAAAVFAGRDAADANAPQQGPAAVKEMTKEEESKKMPLPGQANNHSSTALDKSPAK